MRFYIEDLKNHVGQTVELKGWVYSTRSSGKIAMKLEGSDALIGVNLCTEQDDIMLSTKNGKCIRFPVENLRVFQSRNSTGVRGIKLEDGNEVMAMSILKHAPQDSEIKDKYLKIDIEQRLALREALLFNKNLKENKIVENKKFRLDNL